MQNEWLQYLQNNGAVIDNGIVAHFGNPAAELADSAKGNVVADLSSFGLIRFSGEEAQKFLHGQLSNSVEKLGANQAQYTSYNSPKGRMLASMLLWRDGDDYLLTLPASLRESVQKRLAMFVLRAKVKVTDASADYVRIGVAGIQAAEILTEIIGAVPASPMQMNASEAAHAIRIDTQRFLLLAKPPAHTLWQKLATRLQAVGTNVWSLLDIRAGIPWITPATQEYFVAQMTNFELIGGVDFKKGCYPGQEIVARTQYLGKLKRRMVRVHVDGVSALSAGDELFSADFDGQASGMVVNAAPSPAGGIDALAVIQIDSAATQTIHVKSIDGPALEILELPYPIN
ncbi:MAG: folate-binding protein YgfZ [Burkholderiales bacterium]